MAIHLTIVLLMLQDIFIYRIPELLLLQGRAREIKRPTNDALTFYQIP